MRVIRSVIPAIALAIGVSGNSVIVAEDSTPEQVLSGRGLNRSGSRYLLPAEADFVTKANKLLPSYRDLKAQYDELFAIIQNRAEYHMLDDQWTRVNEQLRNVQAAQDAHPATTNNELKQSWRNLLDAEQVLRIQYNELQREVNLRYPRLVSESKTEQIRDAFLKRRDEFLANSKELRAVGEKITEDYRTLSQDTEVMKALEAIKGSTKSSIGLGPSADFKKASNWLTNAVRSTAPETLKPAAGRKRPNNSSMVKSQSKGKNATTTKERQGKTATKKARSGASAQDGPDATSRQP
jgi:hypothetical protein